MSFRTLAAALVAATLLSTSAFAHSVTLGSLSLTDLWTRATPAGAPTAAGYLTITNNGTEADKLIAASSPAAASGGLHTMTTKDGVMSMSPVEDGIEIPAGGSITLAPGGFHIMFVALKEPLKEGDKFPVSLTFEKAGKIETFLHIKAIGADGPGDMGAMKHEGTQ
jgi:copper(I)-binding protein